MSTAAVTDDGSYDGSGDDSGSYPDDVPESSESQVLIGREDGNTEEEDEAHGEQLASSSLALVKTIFQVIPGILVCIGYFMGYAGSIAAFFTLTILSVIIAFKAIGTGRTILLSIAGLLVCRFALHYSWIFACFVGVSYAIMLLSLICLYTVLVIPFFITARSQWRILQSNVMGDLDNKHPPASVLIVATCRTVFGYVVIITSIIGIVAFFGHHFKLFLIMGAVTFASTVLAVLPCKIGKKVIAGKGMAAEFIQLTYVVLLVVACYNAPTFPCAALGVCFSGALNLVTMVVMTFKTK
jgi:hypothetical protein